MEPLPLLQIEVRFLFGASIFAAQKRETRDFIRGLIVLAHLEALFDLFANSRKAVEPARSSSSTYPPLRLMRRPSDTIL